MGLALAALTLTPVSAGGQSLDDLVAYATLAATPPGAFAPLLGYGRPEGTTLVSADFGLPVALVARSGRVLIAPYLIPAIGWGRASDSEESESGTRFMLGGGLGVLSNREGLGLTLGFQKIFIERGETQVGVTLSYSFDGE